MLMGAVVGLLLWWVWPRPAPPRLVVLTFDQLATPGAEVPLRAQVWPAESQAVANLAGHDLVIVAMPRAVPDGQGPWQAKAISAPTGMATAVWTAPAKAGASEFFVRHADPRRSLGADDRARVFTWLAETPLLLVEVETTLTEVPLSAWEDRATMDIPRLPGTADTLDEVRARKYQIVYLALKIDRPLTHHKVRDWIQLRATRTTKQFPDGPVLGRPAYEPDMDAAQSLRKVVEELRSRFHGPLAAVTRQRSEAEIYHGAGLRTILIEKNAKVPEGTVRVPSWAEVPGQLVGAEK
jgi:hypothetical protein